MAAARSVGDDSVRYYLFPKLSTDTDAKTELEKKLEVYFAKLLPFLTSYIWQDEAFSLAVVDAHKDNIPPHLEGITYYGDNVEDEWFIVFLLIQLTKDDQDLIVKAEDADGEFLLIEAADHIPKWLNPENSENRVFLYRGIVHLISKDQVAKERMPTVPESLSILREASHATRAPLAVQRCLRSRLEGYPDRHAELQHRAHCFLPALSAALLEHDPQLLGPAVSAFVSRDSTDAKALRAMRYFPPETRLMTEVRFTRCLYAQLRQHRYMPDRRTGWNLPLPNAPEFVAHDLGLKVACGLEILAAKATQNDQDEKSTDFQNDVRWKRFLGSLKEKGYFKGELEGSLMYRELLEKAKQYFMHSVSAPNFSSGRSGHSAGERVVHLLRTVDVNVEKLRERERHLKPPDDEKWMEVTPRDLEALLDGYSSQGRNLSDGKRNDSADTELASAITKGLQSFVHHTSDYRGAEFPKVDGKERAKDAISFNTDGFFDAVGAILDFKLPSSDEDSSSMSSYGDEEEDLRGPHEHFERGEPEEEEADPSRLVPDMKNYMDLMDRELARTDVGLSFERLPARSDGGSILKKPAPCATMDSDDDDEESVDDYHPVDLDLTALKNILQSYSCQEGMPGPAGNLLSSMGIHVPPDSGS